MQRNPSALTVENPLIKSPEYSRFREQLKTATELPQDIPLDIVISYLGPDLGLIDRLQTAAENTLLLAQDKTGSHQAYECVLQTAFYYQVAWALAKRYQLASYYPAILEQLKNIEQVFPKLAFEVVSLHDEKQMIIQDFQLHYQNNNQHKKALLAIRDFAKKQLKIYQEQSNNSDLKMMTSRTAPKSVSMQAIYSDISQKIRALFTAIISESIMQYQKLTGVYSPCAYSFIALGSLAREEITPYSDIEFGILIEDKSDDRINNKNKIYFRNLCRLINFKLLALAETPENFISEEFGEKISDLLGAEKHALIPKGFCFDAFVTGGYKNPLGKRDEKGELIFELIGTPSELADFQDEKHYAETGKLVSEPLLPGSLTQARLIIGSQTDEQLLKQYHQKISAYLSQPAKKLWGKPLDLSLNLTLYQARALELLVADIGRFRPKLGKQEEGGRSFAAKHDLYRLPNMMFDQLALYFNLTEINLWEQLNALANSTTAARPTLFSATATKHLARAIDCVTEYRLAAYLALEEQAENAELTDDPEKTLTGSLQKKVFYLPKEAVFDLHRTLIPFWHAMRGFRDSKGQDITVFNHPVFGNFYTKALWVEANMQLLLQGYPQALSLLQSELKKILVSPSVIINFDEKNPVGTLRFAHPTNAPEKSLVGWTKEHSDVSTMRDSEVEQALIFYTAGQAYLESNAALTEAQDYLTRALTLFQNNNKITYSAEILNCYLGLSRGSWLQQNSASAKSHHAKALQLIQTQFGEGHPYYAEYKKLDFYLQQKPGQISNLKLPERIGNWHIPPDNQHFVGRTETLKKLTAHFKPAQAGMKICFLSTISGLGGIGKTQVALKFLHHSGHDYALRLWFRAEKEHTLLEDYIELAERFRLMAMGERLSKEEVIERVKKYLENNPDWLAVYDNATNYASIKQFLPTRSGHVVITTRYSKETLNNELKNEKAIDAVTLEIDKFTPEEALQYFKEMTERRGVEEEQAMQALAKELDYLPLALAQAAAYIKRRGITIQDYRERYKTSQQYLLKDKLLPADSHSLPVATTWEVTLQAIQEEEQKAGEPPLALVVLQAMSYLYADQIPQNLLAQWFKVTRLAPEQEIQNQLKKVLDRLAAYSMIHKNDSKNEIENTVSIHRLVQEVIRNRSLQQQASSSEKKAEIKIIPVSKPIAASDNKNDSKIAVLPQPSSEEEKKKEQEKRIALDKAFQLKKQSKVIYQQSKKNKPSKLIDFETAEGALGESITIYQQYKDSYPGELCDALLDLALLLQAKGTSKSKQAAQKCLIDAKKSLKKSYGKADARQSRCKTVEWYLDAKRDNSIFALKAYPSFDNWQLPANNDDFFVGRESLIEKLNQHCNPDQAYQMLVLSAVSGLGGVGKTQLAIYYLYHAKHQYNLRAWFRAENATLLLSDYRNFAKEFDLIPLDEKTPREEIIDAVKRYLERHPDWLAVYDNAGSRDEIREFLPTKGGHLIVTTRRQEYDDVGIKVAVDVFTEQEAVAYLKKLTGIGNQDQAMAELAKTLGYLPLAIGQAGTYIKKQSITTQQYLNDFKQSAVKLLEAQELALDNRSETVATTWNISLKAIEQDEEKNNEPHLSFPILQVMAHLHAEDIPRDLLEKYLQEQKLVFDPESAKLALDKVIGHLLDYSLIHADIERKTVSVHRLVQEVILQRLLISFDKSQPSFEISTEKVRSTKNNIYLKFFIDGLAASLCTEFNRKTQISFDEAREQSLLSHMQSLVKHCEVLLLNNPLASPFQLVLASLLANIGNVLYKKEEAQLAKTYYERALKIQEIHYGSNHWRLTTVLGNFAMTVGDLGDTKMQKALLERALKIEEAHYGPDHWQVAVTLCNLATTLGDLGDIRIQKTLLERALKIEETWYGPNHWEVADTLGNLANAVGALGDAKRQKILLERVLRIQEAHYTSGHRKVATTLCNLAIVVGDAKMQKNLLERALKIQEALCGPDHVQVAMILHNLATTMGTLGDTKAQKALLERALRIQEAHYGPDRWQVTATLSNLAVSVGALGDTKRKKTLLEQVLRIQEAHYGLEHWQVASTLGNLAIAVGALGDVKRKKTLLERALRIKETYYGPDHWHVAITLINLSNAVSVLGDTKMQKVLLERALKIKVAHDGPEHPGVAGILYNLAVAHKQLKEWGVALTYTERAYRIFKDKVDPADLHRKNTEILLLQLKQLQAIIQPEILASLEEQSEMLARSRFNEQNLDFDAPQLHEELIRYYNNQQNLLGSICHSRIVLRLYECQKTEPRQLASLHHNLACYYHSYAYEQQKSGDPQKTQVALKEADNHFMQGIKLVPHVGLQAEYGNYLLRQQRIPEAIQQLENALKLVTSDAMQDAKSVPEESARLSYSAMERCTLDTTLQKELDCWGEITIKAATFAHYLLVTAYHQQNNFEAMNKIIAEFQLIAAQESDVLTFSLLGHAQFFIKDYANATLSYMRALALKPGYTVAEQQLKQCQVLLNASAVQLQSSQVVADTKSSSDNKLSLANLVASSSSIFSAATATVNPVFVIADDDEEELKKAIQLSLA